jgi:ParB/RepB/Spo0J family partition protein
MPNEMTAAAPIAVSQLLPIALIDESPTNPRRKLGFEDASINELAESIRQVGILQPILVRPLSSVHWELVAGARRFRAAKRAGLAEVPAIIRELTDVQVLELQVVENSQRQDPHPLDEADGYAALCKAAGWTREQLAARLGKSRSHVYSRLALAKLIEPIKEKFAAGEFGAEIAGLIARMPEHLQEKALKAVTGYQGQILSFRDARHALEREFDLHLADAPFDVKNISLVPAAGACAACPKRTGNEPELFTDLAKDDICLDEECFDAKRAAHYAAELERLQADGHKRVELTWPKWSDSPHDAELADKPHPSLDDQLPLRELMPKRVKPKLAVRYDGMPALVYLKEDVEPVVDKLLEAERAARPQSAAEKAWSERKVPPEVKAKQARAKMIRQLCEEFDSALDTEIGTGGGSLKLTAGDAMLAALGFRLEDGDEAADVMAEVRALTANQCALELLRGGLRELLRNAEWDETVDLTQVDAELRSLAKRLGVDMPEAGA